MQVPSHACTLPACWQQAAALSHTHLRDTTHLPATCPPAPFRDASGAASCIKDECAHRACPLSLGKVIDGKVSCAYHGWEFDSDGACTKMPSTKHCRGVGVAALPTVEKDGFVWVWPGDAAPTQVPDFSKPPEGYQVHAEVMVEVPVEHGLLMENLLDLAHAPFTHTSTFAKGWSVPDAVKFQVSALEGGWCSTAQRGVLRVQ